MNILSQSAFFRAFSRKSSARVSLRTLFSVAKERHILKNLPAERLDDLGISSDAAQIEANRPVWDVPGHWKR